MPPRIAVLASGRGSNLRALLDYLAEKGAARGGDVVLVASDKADAGALELARERKIEALDIGALSASDDAMLRLFAERGIDLIVLAGYLRLIPAAVVRAYRGRMLNVHPALLPAFGGAGMYGARVHRAVLEAGERLSGPTVHFVDEEYDRGSIIAQWPLPVLPADTPDTLAARVLRAEHRLLPRAVDAVASGRISLGDDGRVVGTLDPSDERAWHTFINELTSEDPTLAATMDALFTR
ncbi:MAG: phosphoribosylglycinamide formyltransferase [Gemmatimonadota bacterium]|nr:phosphoribosylglycinamide formyltransferase [Gemmatimonadota bacterium]